MDYLTLDPTRLLIAFGYVGFGFIVFAESGILFGFLFPGDSLLFTAGFLASQGILNINILFAIGFVAAVIGDSVGYAFGHHYGPRVFRRSDSRWLSEKHIQYARNFYERHGGKTIILARFMPIVRTLAPIFAGVGQMRYSIFLIYNIVGGLLWTGSLLFLGLFLGNVIPNVDRYLLPIIGLIILISISPGIIHLLRDRELRNKIVHFILRRK